MRYFFQLMLLVLGIAALAIVLVRVVPAHFNRAEDAPFLAKNDAAMAKMMAGMKIKPANDVDRDFVAMMVPHHQGAIDMAQAELSYGHNERLHRIAQEIIVTQQEDIATMRLALANASPTHFNRAEEAPFLAKNDAAMAKMMAGMKIKPAIDVFKVFVAMMVPHHQGAIDMAQAELRYGHNELLLPIAQEIIVTQQQEIAAMRLALGEPSGN
jgi:uncharacterized protein (DUF305 family)